MNETDKPVRLLWMDVETTGLDPARDHLLEASVRVTDLAGVELARHHVLARPEHWETVRRLMKGSPRLMHEVSGLIREVEALPPHLGEIRFVAHGLVSFVTAQAERATLRPAGWNPQFDMRWLSHAAPGMIDLLDYHWMDVQSVFALVEDLTPDAARRLLAEAGDTNHRSDTCLDREIAIYRLLRRMLLIGPFSFTEVTL